MRRSATKADDKKEEKKASSKKKDEEDDDLSEPRADSPNSSRINLTPLFWAEEEIEEPKKDKKAS